MSVTLSAGLRLHSYEIVSSLGKGGMGEVYRARDAKLGRDVAIKVLPDVFAREADRLARFEREARALAALNHPNIAAIHGLEEWNGLHFLVLELVPGRTLADMLTVGPLPLEDCLSILRQVAEALEAAHETGIIHRDLKPGNIKVTADGKAKVLDFGLAKGVPAGPAESDAAHSPTATYAEETREGIVLGTAPYMSPEQARGKPVDRRCDIWAFGCVAFEMLTGRRAFPGETFSDTVAAILKSEPAWSALPVGVPARIQQLLRRCLQRDPHWRLRDIGDARIEIDEALKAPLMMPAAAATRSSWKWIWAAGLLAVIAIVGAAIALVSRGSPPANQTTNWSGERLLGAAIPAFDPRVSPDGQMLAFQVIVDGLTQVAVMKPGSGDWTVLTRERSRGTVMHMSWSKDGTKIYFDRYIDVPQGIYSVPALGGEERLVLERAGGPEPLPDGSLIVQIMTDGASQFCRFWPDSGRRDAVGLRLRSGAMGDTARPFPDGSEITYFGVPWDEPAADLTPKLYVTNLTSGKTRQLVPEFRFDSLPDRRPLAVTQDGQFVLTDLSAGDLHRIVKIPRHGDTPTNTLLTLTVEPNFLDAGPDGSLYVAQIDRPMEVLRFAPTGSIPERMTTSTTAKASGLWTPVQLSDGRVLMPSITSGRSKLLVSAPGKEPRPFVETREETNVPATRAGDQLVAFVIGTAPDETIAIAAEDGRIVRRLTRVQRGSIKCLAASPDGETLFYVKSDEIWAIPAADGEPRKIASGRGIAVDPQGNGLIVQRYDQNGVHLFRLPLAGGSPQEIRFHGDVHPVEIPIVGNAVSKDGRIVVTAASHDSWFWGPALVDPDTGTLERVPVTYEGDIQPSTWGNDGQLIGMGIGLKTELWRFRPASAQARVP